MTKERRSLLFRLAAATASLSFVLAVALPSRHGGTRPQKQMTYEEEVEAVRQKYEPLHARYTEMLRTEGPEAGVEFFHREIAGRKLSDINEIRLRHGKAALSVTPIPDLPAPRD